MLPVSHAPDLKAVNSKTNAAQPGQTAAAKTGFQALIDRVARSSHAGEEKTAAKTAGNPKGAKALASAHEGVHSAKMVVAEKPLDKPEKAKSESRETESVSSPAVLIAATFVLRPDAPKPEPAVMPRALRERGEAKAVTGDPGNAAAAGQAQSLPKPIAKHADRVEGELPKVTFIDRRTEAKEKEKDKAKVETAAAQVQPQQANLPAPEAAAKSDAVTGVAETKVVFHPTDHGTPFDVKPQNTPVAPRDAASFQQYLVDKGYGQMVEQARIVLKDNNAGEIRMTLHPESLGKVKVALNLSDGSLAGQIFVENQTVKDVFQANLDGLLQAFRDGGWNDLNLQVSVGGDNPQRQAGENYQASGYGRQTSLEDPGAVPIESAARIGAWTDRQVNLTA